MKFKRPARAQPKERYVPTTEPVVRRCFTRKGAADFLDRDVDEINRLIGAGDLPIVQLPMHVHRRSHRVLIDRLDLEPIREIQSPREQSGEPERETTRGRLHE